VNFGLNVHSDQFPRLSTSANVGGSPRWVSGSSGDESSCAVDTSSFNPGKDLCMMGMLSLSLSPFNKELPSSRCVSDTFFVGDNISC